MLLKLSVVKIAFNGMTKKKIVAYFIIAENSIIVVTEKGGLNNGTLSIYFMPIFRVPHRPIAKTHKTT